MTFEPIRTERLLFLLRPVAVDGEIEAQLSLA